METEIKGQLYDMMQVVTPGSILHLLAEAIPYAEKARHGELSQEAKKRVAEAQATLIVVGIGLDAVLHR